MKVKKFFAFLLISCTLPAALPAREALYTGDTYNISLFYNDTAAPGDAVFVRMKITTSKIHKKTGTTAILEFRNRKKKIDSTDFFIIKKGLSGAELLAGIPLSPWLESADYSLDVVYTSFGNAPMKFSLPFTLTAKTFPSKTISGPADGMLLPKQVEQAWKLDRIIETTDRQNIFQLENFTVPTTFQTHISDFAERTIRSYTDKKSDTDINFGIDYAVPKGSPVLACGAGKIVLAENRIQTGWSVVIEHLPGLYSLYYHLASLTIKQDQMVKQGDRIGIAEKPFHWEVRLNTEPVNPDFFTTDFAFTDRKK